MIVFLPRGLSTLFKRRQKNPYAVFRRSLALPTEEPDPLLKPAGEARPGGPMSIVETLKLGKSFGHFAANRDIDFRVDPGELRAVIGPNGAGKTTFFNLIAGTIAPTSGTIRYKGRDVTRVSGTSRVHLGIAKAFQTANLYTDQTVRQNCRLAALARVQGAFAPQVFRRSIRLDGRRRAGRARDEPAGARPASRTSAPATSRTATRSGSTSRSRSRRSRRSCCSTSRSPACRRTRRARPRR